MFTFLRSAALWVGRHTFPVAAATVLVVGAAAGGVGYSIAGGHATAAPVSTTAPATTHPAATGKSKLHTGTAASRGQALIAKALSMLSTQTGQSLASIRTQLAAGKSVDAIAGANAPAIQAQVLAQLTKLGDRAVKAKKITTAQETMYLALAKTKVASLMAEPGTQLLQDVQKFLQMLQSHHDAIPSPTAGT
ncbi:MAG: hypothetical protein ABI352_04260 [Candidatus Dormibacter sp.]